MREYPETMGWGPWTIDEYKTAAFARHHRRGARPTTSPGSERRHPSDRPTSSFCSHWMEPVFSANSWINTARASTILDTGPKRWRRPRSIERTFAARGVPFLMSAWIDQVYFYYLDSSPMIIEVWTGDLDSLKASRMYP